MRGAPPHAPVVERVNGQRAPLAAGDVRRVAARTSTCCGATSAASTAAAARHRRGTARGAASGRRSPRRAARSARTRRRARRTAAPRAARRAAQAGRRTSTTTSVAAVEPSAIHSLRPAGSSVRWRAPGADLEAAHDPPAAQVDDGELAVRGIRHERVRAARRDRGVARLAEPAQHAPHAQRAAVEQRHRAVRGVPDERARARARGLDAARAVERGDAAHDAPPVEVDDGDEAVAVGGHQRERARPAHSPPAPPPRRHALSHQTQRRDRAGRGEAQQRTAVELHARTTAALRRAVPANNRPAGYSALGEPVGQRALGDLREARLELRARGEQPLHDRDVVTARRRVPLRPEHRPGDRACRTARPTGDRIGPARQQPLDDRRVADPARVVQQRPGRAAADVPEEVRPDGIDDDVEVLGRRATARISVSWASAPSSSPAAARSAPRRARAPRRPGPPARPPSTRRARPAARPLSSRPRSTAFW